MHTVTFYGLRKGNMDAILRNSIISVYGQGELSLKPDIIKLKIHIVHIKYTVKEAQKNVNEIVYKVLALLAVSKIGKDWIKTSELSFRPEYTWKKNSYILEGQKVEQEIICIVPNIFENIDNIKYILDNITNISDSIECRLVFAFSNYEAKMFEARKLAYSNAYLKAQVYAEYANLKLLKAIKISEFEPADADIDYNNKNICINGDMSNDTSTELPIGDIQISAKLYCDFLAE
jgi:uncharacterized protein YggE